MQLLMEKMMMVQQQEEEFTQEEMVTRFERERTESLLEPSEGSVLYLESCCLLKGVNFDVVFCYFQHICSKVWHAVHSEMPFYYLPWT